MSDLQSTMEELIARHGTDAVLLGLQKAILGAAKRLDSQGVVNDYTAKVASHIDDTRREARVYFNTNF